MHEHLSVTRLSTPGRGTFSVRGRRIGNVAGSATEKTKMKEGCRDSSETRDDI
jgi:hypothetical protein